MSVLKYHIGILLFTHQTIYLGNSLTWMDNFPTCQGCHQYLTLKGPAPYLLPCLHAVCETCVTSTAGGVISCSTCQREVNLTQTHLQKDVVRQREIFHLTVQHRPSELLCTHDDDGNQAVCWCQDCEEFLCEHCQNTHDSFKTYRRHSVHNIGDIQSGSLECEEYCSIHPKFILDFRDKVCNIQICNRCRRGDHVEHDVEDIDVAADLARTEMSGQMKEVQEAVTRHTSYLEVTQEQIQNTEETSQTLENQITATFSSLKTLLVQREKELLIALEQHKEKIKSILGLQTDVFQSKYRKCKTTSEYIHKALLYCSKYDLLNLRNQMAETTRECLASAHPSEPEDFCCNCISMDGLEKLKTLMLSFGAIGPLTDLSTSRSTKKDIATHVEIEQFSEVEDQYKQSIQQLEDHLSTSNSQLEDLQKMMKDMSIQKEKAEQDVTRLTREKEKAEQGVTRLAREKEDLKKSSEKIETDLQNANKSVTYLQTSLTNIGLPLDAMPYFLTNDGLPTSLILLCIQLKFDCDKVNIDKVRVNTDGDLENKPLWQYYGSLDRLANYTGTTSTLLLSLCRSPQYWEVRGMIDIDDKALTGNSLLLEIGLCTEEERDQHHCIPVGTNSYGLNVARCTKHSSICRSVWRHGKYILCLSDTLPNVQGQSATLHYGVVFDDARCRVVFVDVSENIVISTLKDVDCSRPLWPMFGVYNPHLASVSMSLVVGNDIDMSEEKKGLILEALS